MTLAIRVGPENGISGHAEKALLPWRRGGRFFTLLDMLQYPVWQLCLSRAWLERCELTFRHFIESDQKRRDSFVERSLLADVANRLSYCQKRCEDLELHAALARLERFSARVKSGLITYDEAQTEARVLREAIDSDLRFRRFAFVPTDKATKLDNIDKDWRDVQGRFPSARADIREAIECYALDCNTASVFHSMRIAERGLRALAKTLGVTTIGNQNHPLEFAEWGSILNALKGKLHSLQESKGRSHQKAASTKFYADAASQANYLNEIWRKEVSHARGQYNAPEALNALTRTHDFMTLLAGRISEKIRKRK